MLSLSSRGDLKNVQRFLERALNKDYMSILHKCEEKKCQNFELFDEDKITK